MSLLAFNIEFFFKHHMPPWEKAFNDLSVGEIDIYFRSIETMISQEKTNLRIKCKVNNLF